MDDQLDEAFNWLVLILSTIGGSLSQFPELYPFSSPQVELAVLRLMIFPVIVLVFLWLLGLLIRNISYQVVVKAFSWIYASIMLVADLVVLIWAIMPSMFEVLEKIVGPLGGPQATLLGNIVLGLILSSPLYVSILFCLFVIRPRMRETYKDSRFLYSLPKQALLYVAAVLLYFLATGLLEGVL